MILTWISSAHHSPYRIIWELYISVPPCNIFLGQLYIGGGHFRRINLQFIIILAIDPTGKVYRLPLLHICSHHLYFTALTAKRETITTTTQDNFTMKPVITLWLFDVRWQHISYQDHNYEQIMISILQLKVKNLKVI